MADMRERLAKRNEKRLESIDKRKEQNSSKFQPDENKDLFAETFSREKAELGILLSQCQSVADGGDKMLVTQHFNTLSEKCQQIQKFLSDSTMFLPAYDIKLSQDKLNDLIQTVNDERERFLPKKKFAFRSRKKEVEQAVDQAQDVEKSVQDRKPLEDKTVSENLCGFKAMRNESLVMEESESSHQDVGLSNLEGCTVKLLGPPSALHMDRLTDCTIISAPVSSAIFIDECTRCTFVLACQQLRVHKTMESKFYLHVTSRAIVEDCSKVGFAPFTLEYNDKDKHFKVAGLDQLVNNWSLVNDFNWLCKDEHSPNWFVIAEENQREWNFK